MNADAREAALAVLDMWLTRGVDGFRLDVANACLHDSSLTDNPAIPAQKRVGMQWVRRQICSVIISAPISRKNSAVLDGVRRRVEMFEGVLSQAATEIPIGARRAALAGGTLSLPPLSAWFGQRQTF